MNDIIDVINWFETNNFIINPLITIIIIGGSYYAPRILAILIYYNKNASKAQFSSKTSYINYLRG